MIHNNDTQQHEAEIIPHCIVGSISNCLELFRFLSKQFSNTDVMQPYGPHKRRVYLCLPYVGELATNKFARQIRRQIAKIVPCVELRLVFRAAQKLSCLRS